jgi:hypothetical protein
MKGSVVESAPERRPGLNAVALQNAVLCADCDVVSDSPNDTCLVCGSRSLFNIAHMFGGNLPQERARLIAEEASQITSPPVVLTFPKPHRPRKRATVGSRHLALEDGETDEVERGVLLGPNGR